MKSSGSIVNNATITPEFYITNTSGSNITVTVGVNFAYSGNPVTLDDGTNAITETIASSEAKTGNCTTNGVDIGESTEGECWTEFDSAEGKWKEICDYTYSFTRTKRIIPNGSFEETVAQLKATSKGEMTSVSGVATTDEGVYSAPDDYGTSYFFRGAVENNYVKFAGAYWRIIRINGDGTIRMIYDGTSAHANGESSADRQLASKSAFNSSKDDNAYVGFMYGSTGSSSYSSTHTNTNSSTIKVALENWYKGLSPENKGYIVDRVFCGDRKVANNSSSFSFAGTTYTSNGYGTYNTIYIEVGRGYTTQFYYKSPQEISFICSRKEDKYTAEEATIGNGELDFPVGLITASEVRAAGGFCANVNSAYYLYTGQNYWTMSPDAFRNSVAYVFNVASDGGIANSRYNNVVSDAQGVRPVVNLKSDITFTGGNGTKDTPWVVGTGNA